MKEQVEGTCWGYVPFVGFIEVLMLERSPLGVLTRLGIGIERMLECIYS